MEPDASIGKLLSVSYTLSEAWNGVNWADLMAAQGAFGTDYYDPPNSLRSKPRTEYRHYRHQACDLCRRHGLSQHTAQYWESYTLYWHFHSVRRN